MAAGLVTVLEAAISNSHGYDVPVDSPGNEFPAFIVLPDNIDASIAFSGDTFIANFRVVFLVSSGDDVEGFRQLYDHIDPTENNKSFKKALYTDRTLNGKADTSELVLIENIGRRELGGGAFFGFDAIVQACKTV